MLIILVWSLSETLIKPVPAICKIIISCYQLKTLLPYTATEIGHLIEEETVETKAPDVLNL
jgi:hypothetical protein